MRSLDVPVSNTGLYRNVGEFNDVGVRQAELVMSSMHDVGGSSRVTVTYTSENRISQCHTDIKGIVMGVVPTK